MFHSCFGQTLPHVWKYHLTVKIELKRKGYKRWVAGGEAEPSGQNLVDLLLVAFYSVYI